MNNRVRFFSPEDMSSYYNLQKATQVIESISEDKVYSDINDVIELYHIRQFVDNGIVLKDWSKDFIAKTDDFNKIVANYFNGISPDKIVDAYTAVVFEYKESFWKIIDGFDLKGILNEKNISTICRGDKFSLHYILRCNRIVRRHNTTLAALLKEHENAAEWLLDHYVAKHDESRTREPINVPSALSINDKEEIIAKYVDRGMDTNLNYVQLIINAKDNKKFFTISPKTRLKARKLEREIVQQYFKPGAGIPMRTTVRMSREDDIEPVSCQLEEGHFIVCTYDAKLIDKLSNTEIIYYFQYAFEYLTNMGFINLISMSSQEGVMERYLGLTAKDTYRENLDFKSKDQLSVIQMIAMEKTVNETGRRIEDAIKSFYEVFLNEQYGYPSLKITIPSADSSYVEKFRAFAPEMDSVVKQYNLYSKEGEIDPELLALESSIKVTDSASCVDNKYYVVNDGNTDLQTVFYLLFGDQSMLTFVDPYKDENYPSLFSLLMTMKPIDCSKYELWQMERLQPLIEKRLVAIGDNSILQVLDWPKILVLQQLYKFKACSFWYYPREMKETILEMANVGWVTCCNKLLTPEEQNYFSFILNNERYTNAYAIRNLYAHGGNPSIDDEKYHEIAYARLLIMFVLLLLKINDDLSIKTAIELKTR